MKGLALLFVLTALAARADTVMLVSGASVNGTVSFVDGRFIVDGRMNGKPWKSDPLSPQIVAWVDFNSLNYNAGSLPVLPVPRIPEAADFEVLLKRGRSLKKGTLSSLDEMIRLDGVKPVERTKISRMWVLAVRGTRYTPSLKTRP
jgi:hypothetical protein